MTPAPRPVSALGAGLVFALIGSLAVAAPAQAAPAADPTMFCELPGQELAISPADELAEGQAVTWKSTVKGTDPTDFTGEYVGKLDNALGNDAKGNPRDLLLVRLGGPVVEGSGSTLPAGVWAGASGSPVYDADGALIGAVSYSFSTEADNVAGVTPASAMKSIGDLPGKVLLDAAEKQMVQQTIGSGAVGAMTPIKPVRVGGSAGTGLFDRTAQRLKKAVGGVSPVQQNSRAGGGGAGSGEDLPIVPGGNIAVSYAYGAVSDASVGTVTAVCGDQVWAYGHPNSGNSRMIASLHGASAARIVPSAGDSYKLVAKVGKVKGVITDDRSAGIRGTLGVQATTVPITSWSTVDGQGSSRADSYVTAKVDIAPAVAAQVGTDAIRMLDNSWAGSASVRWSIDYQRKNGATGTLSNSNKYADEISLPEMVGADVADDVAAIQANGFETVRITAVRVRTDFSSDYLAKRLTGVQMKRGNSWATLRSGSITNVSRGKNYQFRAVLRPAPDADGTTSYIPFTVPVSDRTKRTVSVSLDGTNQAFGDFDISDLLSALLGGDSSGLGFEPENFDQLLFLLDSNIRNDQFSVTRSSTSMSGAKKVGVRYLTAPSFLVGGTASFKLQVPAVTRR